MKKCKKCDYGWVMENFCTYLEKDENNSFVLKETLNKDDNCRNYKNSWWLFWLK